MQKSKLQIPLPCQTLNSRIVNNFQHENGFDNGLKGWNKLLKKHFVHKWRHAILNSFDSSTHHRYHLVWGKILAVTSFIDDPSTHSEICKETEQLTTFKTINGKSFLEKDGMNFLFTFSIYFFSFKVKYGAWNLHQNGTNIQVFRYFSTITEKRVSWNRFRFVEVHLIVTLCKYEQRNCFKQKWMILSSVVCLTLYCRHSWVILVLRSTLVRWDGIKALETTNKACSLNMVSLSLLKMLKEYNINVIQYS